LSYNSLSSSGDSSVPNPNTNTQPDTTTTTAPSTQPTAQPVTQTETQPTPPPPVTQTETQPVTPADPQPTFVDTGASNLFTYEIFGEKVALVGSGLTLTVVDRSNQIASLSDSDTIKAEVTGVGQLLKKQFTKSDFVNETLKVTVKSDVPGVANVTIGKKQLPGQFYRPA